MADLNQPSYSPYARQRLFRLLTDLVNDKKDMNWSSMAQAIYDWRGVHFDRQNFYRLKKGTLSNANIEFIVQWFEAKFDQDIRERLKPQAIFDEVGKASRDYYFHIPKQNVVEEWDKQMLQDYAGIYYCVPEWDKNSLMPVSFLRQWFKDRTKFKATYDSKHTTLDIKQYINERFFLILQRTPWGYFYAAEFPLSILFPNEFETGCYQMLYEGVGIISSNSIQVYLRDCLSRVPKMHAIIVKPKTNYNYSNPYGLHFYVGPGTEAVRKEWQYLHQNDINQLKQEYKLSIQSDKYLTGPVQIMLSPVPDLKNHVHSNFSRNYVYHRKPADFLKHQDIHFIRSDLENTSQIEKILTNPLTIGELQ